MKFAIIGAGPSGLASAKYALEKGFQYDVFEAKITLGGSWVYTEKIGVDENGYTIRSPMYEGLITNVPKEIMTFLHFPYPEQKKSFITQAEVLDYLHSFADQFDLHPHIKYCKHVIKTVPLPDEKWTVTVEDVKTKVQESKNYDGVIVCTGHYREPKFPKIPNQEIFEGHEWHCENYRTPEPYKGKTVLVIGAGASGQEIAYRISKAAEQVFLSCKGTPLPFIKENPPNLIKKPKIITFSKNGAEFEDGTTATFDIILYCTGYKYRFPFLTEECGIKVDDNWVHPLYKHIVNIEHPTMCFVGLPFFVCIMPNIDIQARFVMATFGRKYELPSKEAMLKQLEDYMRERRDNGIPKKYAHQIGKSDKQKAYFKDLAETAGIENIPLVISNIYAEHQMRFNREDCYKIIDDENFIRNCS